MVIAESFTDALLDGAREVFETMMFMTVEVCDEQDQKVSGKTLLGSITFKGKVEGVLTIFCDTNCARTIADNMLGLDPEDEISEEEIMDAVGEVANMVMGTVKSRMMDSVGDLQVSIPSVIQGSQLESRLGDNTEKVTLKVNLDESVAMLGLAFREVQSG